MRILLPLSLHLLAACAASAPAPDDLGPRLRVRVVGREIPSITTADYFLSFMVRSGDGRRLGMRVYAPESAESEGLSLMIGHRIQSVFGFEQDLECTESLAAADATLVEDVVLPPGYTLCFEPGSCYAYRIVDHSRTMVADLEPEIRIGQVTADGSAYVEVTPSPGPDLGRAQDPPGWPLPSRLP